MKTRYLTLLFLTAAGASFALGACDTGSGTLDPNVEARLRNDLPSVCTAEQIQACPAVAVARCPNGQEPVIDYDKNCCAHFTCQPLCQVAQRTCPMTPAPVCQPGTKLWIGTAIEDCCPAYRCEPDHVCDATNVACTLALPYCGPNVQPIVVGQTEGCCPIYQCPCITAMPDPATGTPPPSTTDMNFCGCTYPSCRAGEEIVCAGTDACKGPCTCQPARGVCRLDTDCGADQKCDTSGCRLPPMPTTMDPARVMCDPTKCGPKLGLPNGVCADGSISGPTGLCLANADGTCGWEVRDCPPTDCYGICVPNVPQNGCQINSDCPMGQQCNVQCSEWGCATGGMGTTDPATGTTPPPGTSTCACDATDNSCVCDANGNCKGRICVGQCVPPPPTCEPIVCPTFAPVCPPGVTPIPSGVDPNTCCQQYICPVCDPRAATSTGASNICPAIRCACAKQVGTDPASCCPQYECGMVNADGTCA